MPVDSLSLYTYPKLFSPIAITTSYSEKKTEIVISGSAVTRDVAHREL